MTANTNVGNFKKYSLWLPCKILLQKDLFSLNQGDASINWL